MIRLRIEHETHYLYAHPVELGRHRLVIRPREGHDLRVSSMSLEITPSHRLTWSRDVFGNSVAIVDFLEPSDLLRIRNDVVVHRTAPFPQREPHVPWPVAYPVVYDSLELIVTAAYQTASYPDDRPELRAWLDREVPWREFREAESLVHALGKIVHERINYRRRHEKGVQSPAQTLSLGSGSCRDMATLLMEAGRELGIAARFASGYLDCAASAAANASMHAWMEFYLPELGWRGFDPTIGEPTSLKHVTTGVSNHPRGVMPVSGMFKGPSGAYRDMRVYVKTEKLANES